MPGQVRLPAARRAQRARAEEEEREGAVQRHRGVMDVVLQRPRLAIVPPTSTTHSSRIAPCLARRRACGAQRLGRRRTAPASTPSMT
jgi:hypothetical protein